MKYKEEDSINKRSTFGWVWLTEGEKDSGCMSQQAGYFYIDALASLGFMLKSDSVSH